MGERHLIERVGAHDLADLMPLMRSYCDFYEVTPIDEDLLALAHALVEDPEHEGVQLLARDSESGRAVAFATIFWTWSTTDGGRLAVMNDLFVSESARGSGLADALIDRCRHEATAHGARRLAWQTAPDNLRAQAVYDRVGAHREQWVDYWLDS